MRSKDDKIWANIDWSVILVYFVLVGLSVSNIYSAVYDPEKPNLFDFDTEHGKQIFWAGLSVFLGIVIMILDSSLIRKSSYWIYGVCIFLLVGVLFTEPINGAKSWFGFGSFGIQPSEVAKFGYCLAIAKNLSDLPKTSIRFRPNLDYLIELTRTYYSTAFVIAFPMILILLQPDAGTLIVFSSVILVLYREGHSGNLFLFMLIAVFIALITLSVAEVDFMVPGLKIKMGGKMGVVLVILLLGVAFYGIIRAWVLKRNRGVLYRALIGGVVVGIIFVNSVQFIYENLATHQKERIDLLLGKIEDPDGKGYNINRAKAAIGSGGFTGKGYMQATLANASQKHVPMQSTDFIFCTWAEERGFLGSILLVGLYAFLLVKMVIMAERQRSKYTRIFAYAAAGVFFFHFLINIGMGVGLMPVIGIPLPLFSYGGSQVLTFSLILFVLVKLDAERKIVLQ